MILSHKGHIQPRKANGPTLNLDTVTYTRSARAKHLRITLRPDQSVTVTIPRHGTLAEAQKFLESKADWLKKHIQKMTVHQDTRRDLKEQENIDLNEAQNALFDRLDYFSKRYDLPYHRATFRSQKTLWGSCSGLNNINLNINLAFLPGHLQDYVLLHELVHLKIKNHSRAFWDQLDQYCLGRARELAKELKQHRLKLAK